MLADFDKNRWMHPRANLALKSEEFPQLIDAGFNHFDAGVQNILQRLYPKSTVHQGKLSVTNKRLQNHKYLISVDGNACAWFRVPLLLFYDSVFLKADSTLSQWFYPGMIPWVDYIPVKPNYEDLPNII